MGLFRPGKPYRDVAKQEKDYFDQIMKQEQAAQQQMTPFVQTGQSVAPDLTGAMRQLMNPEQLTAQWAKDYQVSPYAQNILNQTQAQGMDTASQMGLMGSSAALQNIQNESGKIVSSDEEAFLNGLMQKYMAGIGLGENLYRTGAGTATSMGNQAIEQGRQEMNMADVLGGLKYGSETAGTNMLGKILGQAASAGGQYLTGGFGTGGWGRGAFEPTAGYLKASGAKV